MKKIILLLILLIPLKVNASICVMDNDTNRVLYESNGNKQDLIASTTKILTSLVVINNVKNLDEIIEVDESVLKSYGSNIYIEVGEKISIRNLLYGLMLRSGNDAAIILANYVGGSMEGFSLLMNQYALSLGMNNSYFINSSGLENEEGKGNTSTSCDMSLLMSYANKNKTLMEIMSTKKITVKTNYKTYIWYNKNKLLTTYKNTTGGKTGYTKKAYRTLVTSAKKNNMSISITTLREKDDFNKHKNYYEYIFKNYYYESITNKDLKRFNRCIKDDIYILKNKKEKLDLIVKNNYLYISIDNKSVYKEKTYNC